MAAAKRGKSRPQASSTPRASVSFPAELYRNLELVAKQKKVSIAWVVREAAEKYIADQLSQASGGIP